jgi:hypothetical protein
MFCNALRNTGSNREAVEAERSHDELLEEFNPKSGAAKDCCGAEGSRFFWMDFDSLARYFNEVLSELLC